MQIGSNGVDLGELPIVVLRCCWRENRSWTSSRTFSPKLARRVGEWYPRVLGQAPGSASALKVAYAAWTKGSAALLLSLVAYARSQGVLADLIHEWEGSIPHLPGRLESVASSIGRKAWRFEGEMEQIAAALADSDLPDGFHTSAAEVYARLAELKDRAGPETIDEIFDLIVGSYS